MTKLWKVTYPGSHLGGVALLYAQDLEEVITIMLETCSYFASDWTNKADEIEFTEIDPQGESMVIFNQDGEY